MSLWHALFIVICVAVTHYSFNLCRSDTLYSYNFCHCDTPHPLRCYFSCWHTQFVIFCVAVTHSLRCDLCRWHTQFVIFCVAVTDSLRCYLCRCDRLSSLLFVTLWHMKRQRRTWKEAAQAPHISGKGGRAGRRHGTTKVRKAGGQGGGMEQPR